MTHNDRFTKRSTLNNSVSQNSLSSRGVTRKNSKFISSFTLDDFQGNKIAFENARLYHGILSG